MNGGLLGALAALALCLIFSTAFTWLMIFLGLVSGSAQAAQGMSFSVFPLIFVSSAYVPVETMPDWLQWWAERQPVSVTVRAVRSLMLGTDPTDYVWGSLAWSLGIMVVMAPIAIRKYRKA